MASEAKSIVGQIQLGLPSTTKGQTAKTPVDALVHDRSTLTESVFGPAVYEHEASASVSTFVDSDLRSAASASTPKVFFRMGAVSSDKFWYPWQEHILTSHSATPKGGDKHAGHILLFTSSDKLFEMNRSSKTSSRRGTISDIVKAIAGENGIEDMVIEPTEGEGVYIQSFMTDSQFIRSRLLPRAANKKGSAGFLFFFRDGTLHFHTLDYQASVHDFDYYSTAGAELVTTDGSQKLFKDGIAGARIIVSDPTTGETREMPSDMNVSPKMADVLYPTYGVSNGQVNVLYHLGQNNPDETKAMAQYAYDMARLMTFSVKLSFYGLSSVRIGDILNLSVRQKAGAASPVSGTYYVTKARSVLANKTLMTELTLNRGETSRISNSVTVGSGENAVVPELGAPGRSLNLSEIAASSVTKGAESKTSRTVIVDVRDAVNG